MKRNWQSAYAHDLPRQRHKKRKRNGYKLVVSELPEHVFVKKKINLQVSVVDMNKVPEDIYNVDRVYITTALLNEDDTVADQSLLKVSQAEIETKHGRALVDLTLLGLSADKGNRKFKIRFETAAKLHGIPILLAVTKAFSVVARRIDIIHQPPTVWYKDEGGKQAAIEIRYRVVDADGKHVVGGKRPKIHPKLLFDSGEEITTRKKTDGKPIFRIMEHKPVKGKAGIVMCRYRVDDVSRSHGLQNFKVELRPSATDPNSYDMRSCYSDATEVKSKRKTAPRKKDQNAGLVTQAAILQHIDNALSNWLRPIQTSMANMERDVQHIKQKIERVEHHLGIAPECLPKNLPKPVSLTALPIQASGPARPSQLAPSPNTIGSLPPQVDYGGVGGLPAFQRNVSGHEQIKTERVEGSGMSFSMPSLNTGNLPPFASAGIMTSPHPTEPGFLSNPVVQDLTRALPPLRGVSAQKSSAGYPAFDSEGHIRGFFQTTSITSHARGAKQLNFINPQESGLDDLALTALETSWANEGNCDSFMVADDDPELLKTKLVRKISGSQNDKRCRAWAAARKGRKRGTVVKTEEIRDRENTSPEAVDSGTVSSPGISSLLNGKQRNLLKSLAGTMEPLHGQRPAFRGLDFHTTI